jgi:hypothetical protein
VTVAKTPAQLKADVVAKCRAELGKLENANWLLIALDEMREERTAGWARGKAINSLQKGAVDIVGIVTALGGSVDSLGEGDTPAYAARYSKLLKSIEALPEFQEISESLGHRGIFEKAKHSAPAMRSEAPDDYPHTIDICQQFVLMDALGRKPTIRELALISLYTDPNHGLDLARVERETPATASKTAAEVIKKECNRIRKFVERSRLLSHSLGTMYQPVVR